MECYLPQPVGSNIITKNDKVSETDLHFEITISLLNNIGLSEEPLLDSRCEERLHFIHQVLQFFDFVRWKVRSTYVDEEREERYSNLNDCENVTEEGKGAGAHSSGKFGEFDAIASQRVFIMVPNILCGTRNGLEA